MKGIELGDLQIAIYNVEGEIYATDNICTHAFALLTDGFLDGDVIECPLHGGCFKNQDRRRHGRADLRGYQDVSGSAGRRHDRNQYWLTRTVRGHSHFSQCGSVLTLRPRDAG